MRRFDACNEPPTRRLARNRIGNRRHGSKKMFGRCRKIFSPQTKMVGRRLRRGPHRNSGALNGMLTELESPFDPKKNNRIQDELRFKKSPARMDSRQFCNETAGAILRGAGWWFGGRTDGRAAFHLAGWWPISPRANAAGKTNSAISVIGQVKALANERTKCVPGG